VPSASSRRRAIADSGLASTASMPATGSSRQIRRTESSSWRADSPPGSGVAHVDVHGDAERLGQARFQAAQPDLQEPVTAQRPGLDQAAHRLAVAPQRAEHAQVPQAVGAQGEAGA
jgi:hypothetical protein